MVTKLGRIAVVLWVLMFYMQVTAQAPIQYNSTTLGTLSPEMPVAIYTFQGNADDQITVQAIALTDAFELGVTIQRGVDTMAVSSHDPFTLNSNDARIDYRIPTTATYLILVASPKDQTGDFALKLSAQSSADKSIVSGSPVTVSLVDDAITYYQFSGQPDAVLSLTADTSDFMFYATVYNSQGTLVYHTQGTSARIHLNDNDLYELALRAVNPLAEGLVTLSLAGGTDDVIATSIPVATATPNPTEFNITPTPSSTAEPYETPILDENDQCGIFSGEFPNIRVAPNTFDAIITQVQPDTIYPIVGVYTNWYQILVPVYGSGWVRDDVVGIGGDCANIAVISPNNTPVLPSATPTPTLTPTLTPVISPTPTATNTPTVTPTITNTPLPTDTPTVTPTMFVQVAPTDTDFNNLLNVPLGATLSVINFVSYPDGDRQDRVQWDVTGFADDTSTVAQLVITATCFGTGTEYIEFVVGNRTYGCGDTLVDMDVTYSNKIGVVTITAVDGAETYVQWVLTGSATRK